MKPNLTFQFLSKIISYQGLLVFIPFVVIKIISSPGNLITLENSFGITLSILIFFIGAAFLDFIGLKSKFLDRNKRTILIIVAVICSCLIGTLVFFTQRGWDNSNLPLLFSLCCITYIYIIIGWYYIRDERTNHPSSDDKPIKSSALCFLGSASIWGLGYIPEFFGLSNVIHGDTLILLGLILSLLTVIILLIFTKNKQLKSEINLNELSKRENLVAVTDFLWDSIKVVMLIFTFYILSYNGEIVLFPESGLLNSSIIWRNLMWLLLSASIVSLTVEKLQEALLGRFLVTMVLLAAFGQWVIVVVFNYSDQWLLISILNGATMAGVFIFTEQKMAKSGNVRVLSGIMFFLIFITQLGSILINNPFIEYTKDFLNWARLIISIGGLIYVYIRFRFMPENLDEFRVRYSPLGKKIVDYNKKTNGDKII